MDEERGEFEDWYQSCYRRVYASVLLLTPDRVVAADAVDEAFARALERWPRVRLMASPVGWTWTVARNHIRRSARRSARERAAAERLADTPQLPDFTVEVWDAITHLPRRAQELIALRYVAGLGEREIAETLGIANGTVARGLHDARQRLHQMLTADAEDRS